MCDHRSNSSGQHNRKVMINSMPRNLQQQVRPSFSSKWESQNWHSVEKETEPTSEIESKVSNSRLAKPVSIILLLILFLVTVITYCIWHTTKETQERKEPQKFQLTSHALNREMYYAKQDNIWMTFSDGIDTWQKTMNISDDFESNMIRFEGPTLHLKELVISAKISEKLLKAFVTTYSSLETLTLNVDKLCLGSREIQRDALTAGLPIPRLKTLVLLNDNLCDISAWVYSWRYPVLEHVFLYSTRLKPRSFISLQKLLEKISRDRVRTHARLSVQLSNCTLCNICKLESLNELPYIFLTNK